MIAALHGESCVPNHGTSLEGDGLPRSQLRERALAKPSELSSTPRKASKRSRSFTPSAQVQEAVPNIKGPRQSTTTAQRRFTTCPSTSQLRKSGRSSQKTVEWSVVTDNPSRMLATLKGAKHWAVFAPTAQLDCYTVRCGNPSKVKTDGERTGCRRDRGCVGHRTRD